MPESTTPPPETDGADEPGSATPTTVEEVIDAADDPDGDKQATGEAQAAENRDLDPPA